MEFFRPLADIKIANLEAWRPSSAQSVVSHFRLEKKLTLTVVCRLLSQGQGLGPWTPL